MGKNILCALIVLMLIGKFAFAQTFLKDCNELFDKLLKSKVTTYDRAELKKFLYAYLLSTNEQRSDLKRKASSDFKIGAIIEGIPIEFGGSSSNNRESKYLQKLKTEVEQRGYVTDEEVNLFIGEFYQEGVFDSYKKCLEEAGKVLLNQNGVFATIEGDVNSSFILKISFSSTTGQEYITINKAVFDGCNIKHGSSLEEGTQIRNNQAIYQHLQRIPNVPANITISFKEGIQGISKTFQSDELSITSNKVPIGTIIASTLDYQSFLDVNNDKQLNFDIKKSTWAPCDGRLVSGSKYGSKISNVPDLRGIFLRGINDMEVEGASPANINQLNPTKTIAGEFQTDELKAHSHKQTYTGGNHNRGRWTTSGVHGQLDEQIGNTETSKIGGDETRPKNVTVYYYIRIN